MQEFKIVKFMIYFKSWGIFFSFSLLYMELFYEFPHNGIFPQGSNYVLMSLILLVSKALFDHWKNFLNKFHCVC